ncbi:hypothetical protein E2C01_084355 [Portunus trituberculatus]|uniref:Uncharacterized protein n=1 Tax=Portunus trituberculatus TaxID=210409 RepID=A0A5B7IY17_PORTR|nr:hypothetical protein [Portunus trituberculatus]
MGGRVEKSGGKEDGELKETGGSATDGKSYKWRSIRQREWRRPTVDESQGEGVGGGRERDGTE